MKDPKHILTPSGNAKLNAGIYNTEEFIFFLTGHADDLGIGETDEEEYEALGNLVESFNYLKTLLQK